MVQLLFFQEEEGDDDPAGDEPAEEAVYEAVKPEDS
jgi:hypothetical protein